MSRNGLISDHLMPDSGFFLKYREEIFHQRTRHQEARLVSSDTFGLRSWSWSCPRLSSSTLG